MLFFWNFLLQIGWELIGTITFIFSLSLPFPACLAWKEALIVFYIFLNFFSIVFEFSITGWIAIDRNDHFSFLFFSAFPNMFWLVEKPQRCFIIFWIFLVFFSNSLVRVGWQLIGTIIFFFSISWPFPTCFGLKRSSNGVLQFFEFFFLFFLNSLFQVWEELIGTIIFIFSLSLPFLRWFGLKRSRNDLFLIFRISLFFFFEFSIMGWVGIDSNDKFHFLSFAAFPNLVWLWKKL